MKQRSHFALYLRKVISFVVLICLSSDKIHSRSLLHITLNQLVVQQFWIKVCSSFRIPTLVSATFSCIRFPHLVLGSFMVTVLFKNTPTVSFLLIGQVACLLACFLSFIFFFINYIWTHDLLFFSLNQLVF